MDTARLKSMRLLKKPLLIPAYKTALVLACFCFLIQFLATLYMMGPSEHRMEHVEQIYDSGFEHYVSSMVRWDSVWYLSIIDNGYISSIPPKYQEKYDSNVAFFPAYPMISQAVSQATGLSSSVSMLVVSHFFAFLCWFFFFLCLLSIKKITFTQIVLASGLFLCFPTAFYNLAGYSESMFLASSLAFIYFSGRSGLSDFLIGGLFGFLMTSTRIVGIGLALTPPAADFINRLGVRLVKIGGEGPRHISLASYVRPMAVLIALFALLGASSFFLYCHLKWGVWDLYSQTQVIGWGVTQKFEALVRSETWTIQEIGEIRDTNRFSRVLVPYFSWGIAVFSLVTLLRRRSIPWISVACVIAAGVSWAVNVVGLFTHSYLSMSRYLYPVWVLLLISLVGMANSVDVGRMLRNRTYKIAWNILLVLLLLAVLCFIQISLNAEGILLSSFADGGWVA